MRSLLVIVALAACEGRAVDESQPHAIAIAVAPRPPLVRVDSISGIAECDAVIAAYDSYASCGALAREQRQSLRESVEQVRHGLRQLKEMAPEAKQHAALDCGYALDEIKRAAFAAGCKL